MKTLKDVNIGEHCIVDKIIASDAVKRRFMDLGITKGVEIYVQMQAPLKDPLMIKVRGYKLAIRKSEAELILVD
jgi:ferrous iron transport protein A